MRRAKRRIFSGVVCEQIVFSIPDRLKNLDKAEPRPRFKNEAEREAHKLAISRRKHNEFFNENFSPTSLYSTLTLDNEHEVHTFDEAGHLLDLYVRRLKYDYDAIKSELRFEMEEVVNTYAVGGCDLSATTDLTAATLLIRKPGDPIVYVLQQYFLPEKRIAALEEKNTAEAPYRKWADRGLLTICEGNRVN